jgi:glutaredoxin
LVTLYTQPNCGPCTGAKAFLEASGVPYRVVDITQDHGAAERLRQNGFTGTPVVGYDGHLYTVDYLVQAVADIKAKLAGHYTTA